MSIEERVAATTKPVETLITLALTIDREKLNRMVGMMESDIGVAMRKTLPGDMTSIADSGVAMLKLTAFYLDELNKLFPKGKIP